MSNKGTFQVIYGGSAERCGCVCFLDCWQDIFVPAMDNAIVLHNLEETVIFYCDEEKLEIAKRITQFR